VIAALMIPLLAAATNWLNVKLMPTADTGAAGDQMASSMKTMNIMMPIMSAVFCYSLPAGMGLYWIAGAVIRSIQQIVINKHIDKMDIDAMIEKNIEKNKAKEEKNAKKNNVEDSGKVSGYSTMNTRRLNQDDKFNTKLAQNKEDEINQIRENRKKTRYKAGSLSAKANMVSDYNETGNQK
jgi:YidC/Oxa1 family membrane protein insertase